MIFWEHKLGAEILKKWKLPNGISILPISVQYADEVNNGQRQVIPKLVDEAPPVDLAPVYQGRHIPRIDKQAVDPPGGIFIQENVKNLQGKKVLASRNLPKPTLNLPGNQQVNKDYGAMSMQSVKDIAEGIVDTKEGMSEEGIWIMVNESLWELEEFAFPTSTNVTKPAFSPIVKRTKLVVPLTYAQAAQAPNWEN